MNNPSIIACGACHDGIDFVAGTGTTLAGLTTGHGGGPQPNGNANCGVCHLPGSIYNGSDLADVVVAHRLTVPTLNNPVVKAGVSTITYALKSVTINGSNQPVVTFQIKKNGVAVTLADLNVATPTTASNGSQAVPSSYQPITGLTRGPSIYVAYAVAQDGVANPADFNGRVGASLANLMVPVGTSPNAGSIVDDPANTGYLKATLTGDPIGQPMTGTMTSAIAPSPISIPTTGPTPAKMVTGMIVGYFQQGTVKIKPVLKTVVANGYTGRRVIVSAARCNTCHEQLGTDPEFHNGERNDPTACAICHNPNQINDGAQTKNYGWAGATNTYIHGIHAASKRTVPFMWAAWDFPAGLSGVLFPKSALTDCGQCHEPNTVNFGATGTTVAPNLLFTTTSAGTSASVTSALSNHISPYIDATKDYGLPPTVSASGVVSTSTAGTNLVNSPIASACFSCHDTSTAKNHMETNGAVIYGVRGTNPVNTEACLACHGLGKIMDAAVVHQ